MRARNPVDPNYEPVERAVDFDEAAMPSLRVPPPRLKSAAHKNFPRGLHQMAGENPHNPPTVLESSESLAPLSTLQVRIRRAQRICQPEYRSGVYGQSFFMLEKISSVTATHPRDNCDKVNKMYKF